MKTNISTENKEHEKEILFKLFALNFSYKKALSFQIL